MNKKAIFRADDHTYWLGKKQLISVTQLMRKHGLGTDYSKVDSNVLNAKAARGTFIHKEIEEYIKTAEVGFSSELQDFIDETEKLGFGEMFSEIIVNNDLVAGTADLIAHTTNGRVLADIKTSVSLDKRAVAWQLSLYERLSGETFVGLYVFHLGEKSRAVQIERIAAEDIDRLLECERNGEIYQELGLVIANDLAAQVEEAENALAIAVAAQKAAEVTAKALRETLYNAMAAQGIKSWETPSKSMLITIVEPHTKTQVNGAKLKEELPDIFEKYKKISNVKGHLKITIRED